MDFHELVQAAQDEDPAQFAARFPNPFLLEEGRQEGSSPKKGSDHDLPAARRVFEVARRDREDGEVVIGRAPEADIAIADPAVDLRHAMLKRALAAWTVRDLHARGGTIVNGSRLPAGATLPISTGAKLGLGSKLTFRFLDAAGLHAELEVLSPKLGKAAHKMPGDWTQQLQAVEVSLEEAPRLPPPSRAQGFADTELVARCDPLPAVPLPRDREITIGRVPGNDLVLPHRSVSKEHASLMRVGDAVRVRDLGSANGVTIGGRRVHGEAFAEVDGPPIEIGPYEVVIAPAGAGHRAGERTEAIGTVGVRALLDTLPLSEFLQ
ncbi:FHA domain-containing protein [bacterium]|nr:FHA domain-containing protein [bacterium]